MPTSKLNELLNSQTWSCVWEQANYARERERGLTLNFLDDGTVVGGGRDAGGAFEYQGTWQQSGEVELNKRYVSGFSRDVSVLYRGSLDANGVIRGRVIDVPGGEDGGRFKLFPAKLTEEAGDPDSFVLPHSESDLTPNTWNLLWWPASSWGTPGAIHSNIKGEWRRKLIDHRASTGEVDDIPAQLFADELPGPLRDFVGRLDPRLMGGEYLPGYLEDEVEIARVSLDSTTGDVISVRARREGDVIRYWIVDEYETEFTVEPAQSTRPLEIGDLIYLLDTAKHNDDCEGIVQFWWDQQFEYCYPLDECVSFATVSSEIYPQLEAWYAVRAEYWKAQMRDIRDDPSDE